MMLRTGRGSSPVGLCRRDPPACGTLMLKMAHRQYGQSCYAARATRLLAPDQAGSNRVEQLPIVRRWWQHPDGAHQDEIIACVAQLFALSRDCPKGMSTTKRWPTSSFR